jgi:DNA-binding response OmpR family regulator
MESRNTILVVDDDLVGRQVLEAFLLRENYRLLFAEDGKQAIDMAEENDPDMILLDIMMPKLDGFDVCQHMRKNPALKNTPIIMVTALDDRESKVKGLEAGADDFITKPIDRTEVVARIRNLLLLKNKLAESEASKIDQQVKHGIGTVEIIKKYNQIYLTGKEEDRNLGMHTINVEKNKNFSFFTRKNNDTLYGTIVKSHVPDFGFLLAGNLCKRAEVLYEKHPEISSSEVLDKLLTNYEDLKENAELISIESKVLEIIAFKTYLKENVFTFASKNMVLEKYDEDKSQKVQVHGEISSKTGSDQLDVYLDQVNIKPGEILMVCTRSDYKSPAYDIIKNQLLGGIFHGQPRSTIESQGKNCFACFIFHTQLSG